MLDKIFDYTRYALYVVLIFLCYTLFQIWEKEHPKVSPVTEMSKTSPDHFVPATPLNHTTKPEVHNNPSPVMAIQPERVGKSQLITVQTDVLNVKIDSQGGDLIDASLVHYPEELGSTRPVVLFNTNPQTKYIAESGLLGSIGPDTAQNQAQYTVEKTDYVLSNNQNEVTVNLSWHDASGVNVTKFFTFTRGSYEIKVGYLINNESNAIYDGSFYTQLLRTNSPPPSASGFINLATYFGAAISSPKEPFTKISFKDMEKANLNQSAENGWAAMMQHYFISAWIPPKNVVENYYTRVLPGGLYAVGMVGEPIKVAPKQQASTVATLYVGPAKTHLLQQAAPNLKLTIDYGWFWFISVIIFWMMQKIYDVVGNWGWSIVLVTVIIKAAFYQLSAKSFRSMAAMKKLQPKIETLKQRYADDKQKMTQATLELYRQEKVNPMSGCLPILIQIPVFIALYWVLVESVELRQAPFILWIHDLSMRDPYYILPLLMGGSMFLQQRLNPPPPDPVQAKVMMLMPVIFTILFANFPAGLMLYWFVNNTLSFLQQWYVMSKLQNEPVRKKS